jgi:hypothetical protein
MSRRAWQHVVVLKHAHDPSLDIFDQGIAVLRRGDEIAGYVVTKLSTMWAPSPPFTRQDWVWLVIVWANGTRERPIEDYPPWTIVNEIQGGILSWGEGDHQGTYDVEWVPDSQRQEVRAVLGISRDDF